MNCCDALSHAGKAAACKARPRSGKTSQGSETPRPACGWQRRLGRSSGLRRNLDPASGSARARCERLGEPLCVSGLLALISKISSLGKVISKIPSSPGSEMPPACPTVSRTEPSPRMITLSLPSCCPQAYGPYFLPRHVQLGMVRGNNSTITKSGTSLVVQWLGL